MINSHLTLFTHTTPITLCFLRLFMVRIFPRAAVQAKITSLKGTLSPSTPPRERGTLMKYDDVEERSNIKHPFLEGTQHNLSSPPYLNLKEYNKLKNEVKTS